MAALGVPNHDDNGSFKLSSVYRYFFESYFYEMLKSLILIQKWNKIF